MRILRNYILKELLWPFLLSLIIFNFVLLMGNLIKLAELMVNKGVSIIFVLKLFLFLIPSLLSLTIPMAVLTATLLAFGRLASDNEIISMRASGLNLYSIAVPMVVVGLILSLFLVFLNDRVIPQTIFASRQLVKEIGVKNPTAYLEEGTFIKAFKDYVIYIHKIEKNKLYGIRVYQPQTDRPARTILADSGQFFPENNSKVRLELYDGTSDEPDLNDPNTFYKLNFKVYKVSLDLDEALGKVRLDKKPKDMTIHELRSEIARLKGEKIDSLPLVTEIYRKISRSFAVLIFILIGLPLAVIAKRGEKSIGFGLSFIVIVLYYLLLLCGESLSLRGMVSPAIGVWAPNVILGIAGFFLLHKAVES